MPDIRFLGQTSNLVRFRLVNSSTGNGLTGLTGSSSGLIISTICDNESTATTYTATGSTIQTIATLGTFAAPSAGDCRLGEVDSTNQKGLYEFQFADARFAVSNSKRLVISVTGATNLLDASYEIELPLLNVFDGVHAGLSALPNASPGANGGLPTVDANNNIHGVVPGTGTGQLNPSGGKVPATVGSTDYSGNTVQTKDVGVQVATALTYGTDTYPKVSMCGILGSALTETVTGYLAAGFKFLLNIAAPVFNIGSSLQSGDSFSRLGAPAGASVSSDVAAVLTAVNNINNLSALANLFAPSTMARPVSGSTAYIFSFITKDGEGHQVDVDSNAVTLTVKNSAGTDL